MNYNNYKERFDELKDIKDNEEFLERFINLVKDILYERDTFVENSSNESERYEFYSLLKSKIIDMYNSIDNRDRMSNEISFIGCGHSSLVFKINDFVLKIDKSNIKRKINEYDDFNCIVPILYNESIKVSDREYYGLQISPFVDTNDIEEVDVYKAYKRLRDLGYIWNDPKEENVGRIINDIDFNGNSYHSGDIVIIDLEDFAYVGEVTPDEVLEELAFASYNSKTYTYEVRYSNEKASGKLV